MKSQNKLVQARQLFELNPEIHNGTSLADIDCQYYKTNRDKKNKALIAFGKHDTHFQIKKFFLSRCDFDTTYISGNDKRNDYYFKWADYFYWHDFDAFQEGKQIINYIENSKQSYGFKDNLAKNLWSYDELKQNKIYNSSFFIPKTYIFDLDSTAFNEDEQDFIDNVHDGIWITKDPQGSLGKEITLYRDVNNIKKYIVEIKKNQANYNKTDSNIRSFGLVQKYIENPLLLNKKKFGQRVFALIASVDPFVVLYQRGFVSKCICNYDLDFQVFDASQKCKHLTQRRWQEYSQDYQNLSKTLQMSPEEFDLHLEEVMNLSQSQINKIYDNDKKLVLYTILSGRQKLKAKIGQFQLISADLLYDDQYNSYLLEFNTGTGFYTKERVDRIVVPQLIQSMLDLILFTYQDMKQLKNVWSHPEKLNLQKWEILYNEATLFNILESKTK